MKTLLLPLLLAATPAFADPAATCPAAGEQLTEHLAGAKQRVGRDGEVRVAFDVTASGRVQLVDVQGTRAYRTPVRIAVDSLDCRAGTPQRYVAHIRFADATPQAMASAASAALAQVQPSTPR